jgi:hypothetical protein
MVAAVGVVEVLRSITEQPRVGRADRAQDDQHPDSGGVLPPLRAFELLGHPAGRLRVAAEQPPVLPRVGGEAFQGAADFDLELIESRTLDGHTQGLIYRPTLHV